jgi:exo-beta-1,3-glucanase (GH17 family)
MIRLSALALVLIAAAGCTDDRRHPAPRDPAALKQSPEALLAGQAMAVAYSGYREGQHPDREGLHPGQDLRAVNPTREQVLEDLQILAARGFGLIRMYDSGDHTETALELIREHELPIKVLLGIWLKAEVSNHEGCEWLTEPIPADRLADNVLVNAAEIERGIALARRFPDIVVAVNVGNEALVEWTDHMVPLDKVIAYVRRVRAAIDQPVTVADNYEWWARDGRTLAAEVDFLGVHTYPQWEEKSVEEALPYTIENLAAVRAALPDKPIAVLEAGWATVATEFDERANESDQARHFRELQAWARANNTTVFWFEAFDEPWKGHSSDPLAAEKHWGLYDVNRRPKLAMQ